jgi:probable rRNA maturation factor
VLTIDVDIAEIWGGPADDLDGAVRSACGAAVRHTGFAALVDSARAAEISIQLSDNSQVHALNLEWRGKDKPTNVLSFPMLDVGKLAALADSKLDTTGPDILLGDIILAHGICAAEAAEKQISLIWHMQHLVVHGTLHLLGYNHEQDDDAAQMEALETDILASLGLPDPYILSGAA